MKKKLFLVFTFLGGLSLSSFLYEMFFHSKKNVSTLQTLPFYHGCPIAERNLVSYKSHLIVLDDFAKKFDLIMKPEIAVKEQMKFLSGLFHYATDNNHGLPEMPFQINVTKVTKTFYDNTLFFDYKNNSSDLYPEVFFKPRFVKPNDKAVRIDYEANFYLTLCRKEGEKKLKITLPRDPYLAFWEIPIKNRIWIKNHGRSELANPCVADRYAVLKYPPHYWYTYQPWRIHNSENFDCNTYLSNNKKVITTEAFLKKEKVEKADFTFKHLESLSEIKVSIIFALISNEEKFQKNFLNLVNYFKSQPDVLDKIKDQKKLFEHIHSIQRDQDPSLVALFSFLNETNKILKLTNSKISFNNDHLILDLHGFLENIDKKIVFSIYLGGNALSSQESSYWSYVKNSFERSDLIFYISHSGHGENMKLERLMNSLSLTPKDLESILNVKKYQFIGIMSCFSTLFHRNEIKQYLNSTKTIDLMLMGSDGYNFLAPLIPLAKLNKKPISNILNWLGSDGIITIDRINTRIL